MSRFHDAIGYAGGLCFRAIILTSLAAFADQTPMLLEKSVQAWFLIPMAVSLGFDVLFSTFTTPLCIPCRWMIHRDIKHPAIGHRGRLLHAPAECLDRM